MAVRGHLRLAQRDGLGAADIIDEAADATGPRQSVLPVIAAEEGAPVEVGRIEGRCAIARPVDGADQQEQGGIGRAGQGPTVALDPAGRDCLKGCVRLDPSRRVEARCNRDEGALRRGPHHGVDHERHDIVGRELEAARASPGTRARVVDVEGHRTRVHLRGGERDREAAREVGLFEALLRGEARGIPDHRRAESADVVGPPARQGRHFLARGVVHGLGCHTLRPEDRRGRRVVLVGVDREIDKAGHLGLQACATAHPRSTRVG